MPKKYIKVPSDYLCPICEVKEEPEHDRYMFSKVTGCPICEGCDVDISFYLDVEERSDNPDCIYPELDRLETLTGRSFHECQRLWFQETIESLEERLLPENIRDEVAEGTNLSYEEVVDSWKRLIEHYKKEIHKLGGVE